MMLTLVDILEKADLDPREVAVMLHTPKEPKLRRALPWLVTARPAAFETYQSEHNVRAGATLRKRHLVASFVDIDEGRLVLAGIYAVEGWRERPYREIRADPDARCLKAEFSVAYRRGTRAPTDTQTWFTLVPTGDLAEYRGRLMIRPRWARTNVRLAEKLDAPVAAITEESLLSPPPPSWRELFLTSAELAILPASWTIRLAEWRGIYLIIDESDGARYVGAAYGTENLLGRWRAHVAMEKGVTRELARRRTADFRFSILERVSPDMSAEEVIALEHTWMERLHTRQFGLNA